MAEFEVVRSVMNSSAGNISKQTESFRQSVNTMVQAANAMHDSGWQDDAVVVFLDKMQQLNTWAQNMAEIMTEYGQTLNDSADIYGDADTTAAKNWSR